MPATQLTPRPAPVPSRHVWQEIPYETAAAWTPRLLSTQASYTQYPYWIEPYRGRGYTPHYLVYGSGTEAEAFAAVLLTGMPGFRLGVLARGPVSLQRSGSVSDSALENLVSWARGQGCIFLRCTHPEEELLARFSNFAPVEPFDAYPFLRDPRNSLLVELQADDQATLKSFQSVARYEIRAAERAGYRIGVSGEPEETMRIWPMLERLAARKGFALSSRSRSAWLDIVKLAREHACVRQYSAWLGSERILTILVIRYGATAEYMLGALDFDAVKGRPSPSCLVHWAAMRDFRNLGCRLYNLGGPGDGQRNMVLQFKRKFHPDPRVLPPPVTLALDRARFNIWKAVLMRGFLPWRSRVRRLRAVIGGESKLEHSG